ncbi:MAG: hypothetical protein FIB00_03450 [Chloroflexi bacterium]|nr:hypothetical protein [Chloroflexota bacterium]PWB46724.1 MAG: hypothetical protein C3F10_03800 [Dehalococcoidia bacterium]
MKPRPESADPPDGYVMAKPAIVEPVVDSAGIYANFANVGQTPEDITIDFATLISSADGERFREQVEMGIYPAISSVRIRLPIRVARGLAMALLTQLEKAEEGTVFRPREEGTE